MILLFTRDRCAYCPMVKRYLEMKGVSYEERMGNPNDQEYLDWVKKYGPNVPLVVNTDTGNGVSGNDYGRIAQVAGVS